LTIPSFVTDNIIVEGVFAVCYRAALFHY